MKKFVLLILISLILALITSFILYSKNLIKKEVKIPVAHAAATINAASCNQGDVQAAVNSASVGDSVNIPAGNCTWSSAVVVNKGITIQGAGCTLGTIGDRTNLPTSCSTALTPSGSALFQISNTQGFVRISTMEFNGGSGVDGTIAVSGNNSYIRVDHLKITNSPGRTVRVGGDYSYIVTHSMWPIKILNDHINSYGGASFLFYWGRAQDWREPDNYGTDNFIFIEDSYFNTPTVNGGMMQCVTDFDYNGGRLTARYNTMINNTMCMHDAGNGLRSFRLIEMYNNTVICNDPGANCASSPFLELRGGTGVFYNNTGTGDIYGFQPEIFRAAYPNNSNYGYFGSIVGCASGNTHKACIDPVVGVIGHCPTSKAACVSIYDPVCGSETCTLLCTSNSDCASGLCGYIDGSGGVGGTGYPCRDQNGWGQDDPVTGQNTPDPYYVWNNYQNGSLVNAGNWGYSQLQENRDFCNHSPVTAPNPQNPGTCNGITLNYTPYTYPHPCQTNWPACSGGPTPTPTPNPTPTPTPTPTPFCGDGSCNGSETCSSCLTDCGTCPSQNPIAWWKFDESSGTTASDSSNNGYTGTLVNGPVWTTGKLLGALSFNGFSQYVDLGTSLSITSPITISAWVNNSLPGADQQIISKGYDGTNTQWELKTTGASGQVSFQTYNSGSGKGVQSVSSLSANIWTLITGTYDGTTWRIYWNGTLNNSQTASGPVATSKKLLIGAVDINGTPGQFWHGLIDDVRIYNRALSLSEIQALYDAAQSDTTPPAAPTGLAVS